MSISDQKYALYPKMFQTKEVTLEESFNVFNVFQELSVSSSAVNAFKVINFCIMEFH